MLVVKADAYGHNANWVISTLKDEKVDYYAVATAQEAERIKKKHPNAPVFLLSEPPPKTTLREDITYTVYSEQFLETLSNINAKIRIHFKLNTGLNRLGCSIETLEKLISNLPSNIMIEGIYTHLIDSQNLNSDFTKSQIIKFNEIKNNLKIPNIIWHIGNTDAHIHDPLHGDMLRVGYGLYKNVMAASSYVMSVQTVLPGEAVSYGPDFIATNPMRIAVIPIGYADGYSTVFSKQGYVFIKGYKCDIIGRVCMDMIMVNITNHTDIRELDTVEILGKNISLDDLSKISNLNPREISCLFGNGKRY